MSTQQPPSSAVVASPEEPLTITKVAAGITGRISAIPRMWLTGEVLKINSSPAGTFITLTDPGLRSNKQRPPIITARVEPYQLKSLPLPLKDGDQITALATLAYWPSSSSVAASLVDIRLAGEGALLERIEILRRALHAEGVFDQSKKLRLPGLPAVIGLITGKDSHAESDVVTRTRERWPQAVFRTIHVPVQGPSCAPAVINALRDLDMDPEVEVIVVARGGGSITDLAPFSDESLVRAASKVVTPLVSAIGHEPDRPILDDVADARAGTPTQAASLIVADVAGERGNLGELALRVRRAINARLTNASTTLAQTASRPVLRDPRLQVQKQERDVESLDNRLGVQIRSRLTLAASSINSSATTLTALSPMSTLQRGYSIVRRADGEALGPLAEVAAGTALDIRTAEGHLTATASEPSEPKIQSSNEEN